MKKYIYSLTAFFTVALCSAQLSLSQAEYFWDTDPGEGSGTAITSSDGSFNSAFEKVAIAGLGAPSVGLHKFCVRVKDNTGVWSPVVTNVVKVETTTTPTPVSLSQAEYFWDTDPGEGSGTTLLATDGNFNSTFEKVAVSGLGAPSVGLHKFNIRVKDNAGVWSPVVTNVVKVEVTTTSIPVSLSQAEYFWDADPGEGSATALLSTDGNFNNAFEKVAVSGLGAPSAGLHKFSIRIKDNTGVWSPVVTNVVVVGDTTTPTPVSLTQAEYFWDTDPGEGSATPFAAADGNFNNSFEKLSQSAIPIVNPVGLHVFNVRVKDNTGVWGPVFKNAVVIESVLSVTPHNTASNYYFVPNPATSVIRFNKDIDTVTVIDLNGRQVASSAANNNEVNIEGLAAGTYILKVTTPDGLTFNKKMIKR